MLEDGAFIILFLLCFQESAHSLFVESCQQYLMDSEILTRSQTEATLRELVRHVVSVSRGDHDSGTLAFHISKNGFVGLELLSLGTVANTLRLPFKELSALSVDPWIEKYIQEEFSRQLKIENDVLKIAGALIREEASFEDIRFEKAKEDASIKGNNVSQFIEGYGITNSLYLFEIAKTAAKSSPWYTSKYIQNYGITDTVQLLEIAKVAAEENGPQVSEWIQNYGLSPSDRFEVVKIAAYQNTLMSYFIQNYDFKNIQYRVEMAKIIAAQNGGQIAATIGLFGIEDQDVLFELAQMATIKSPRELYSIMSGFKITKLSQISHLQALSEGQSIAIVSPGSLGRPKIKEIFKNPRSSLKKFIDLIKLQKNLTRTSRWS